MLPSKTLGAFTALALILISGSAIGVDGLSCLKCKGDCEVAKPATCPSGETQCFAKYDERVSVIEMGCKSDYSENQILENFKDFYFCEGDECNDYEKIPDDGQCAVCNSVSDEGCASKPSKLSNNRCSKAPHKDCYSRLTSSGAVERGCVSNLDSESFKNCYLGIDKSCFVCSEPGCNKNEISSKISCFTCKDDECEIPSSKTCEQESTGCFTRFDERADIVEMGCKGVYSEQEVLENFKSFYECEGHNCNDLEFLPNDGECKVCSSAENKDCIENPGKISDSLCGKPPHTNCFARLTEQNTVERGCASNLDDAHFKNCMLKNDPNCFVCSEKGCNTNTIKPEDVPEDLVGVWQELPVNCYHCTGDNCKEDGNWILKSCSSNKYQTCSTVFGASGEVTERGCSDTVKASQGDYCTANPEKCVKCKSNGCNDFTDATGLIECLSCDVNGDCTKTTQCNGKCMVAINPLTNAIYRGCLSDKELDDRDSCGTDGSCKTCDTAKCNDFDLEKPVEGFSCNFCNGADCDTPVSKACAKQVEGDKCFMRFDGTASVIEMGCTSQVEETELLANYKDYFICDGENCNKYENLPLDGQCADCNSLTDETCATKPASLKTRRCGLLPHTGCYSRVNQEGHTIRGCLSNLERELFADCVLGKDGKCKVCDDSEGCNRVEIPENRLKCNRCSSSNKSECERNGVDLGVCPLLVDGDVCVTKYENGVTTRGCGFEVTCAPGESENTCRTCQGDGCNDVNLAALQGEDGIVGLFQELPVNCEHCKGDKCKDENDWILRSCTNNKYQTCSTVFGAPGEVIERGCSDTVRASQGDYCTANPGKCVNCKSNGCNNFALESELVECYSCDLNGECLTKTVQCAGECMVAKNPLTGEIYRGCLSDKDLDDQKECNKDNSCKTCNSKKCNDFDLDPIPTTGSTCNKCIGGDGCETVVPEKCNSISVDQCYTLVDDQKSVVGMGCRSALDDEEFVNEQLKAKLLYFCDGDLCNTFEKLGDFKQCLSCNSLTNPECATFGLGTEKSCRSAPYFECYKRILPDGHTERGCLSNLEQDEFLDCLNNKDESCQSCLGDQCNDGLIPKDRLQCYKCDSHTDPTCASEASLSAACVKHVANDVCVSKFALDGSVVRGCQSDVSCEASDDCKTCKGNNCNDDILVPSFSCNVCDGDCEFADPQQCANPAENEQCFIRFEENSITKMGCRSDLNETEIDENLNKYLFCEGENCNEFSLIQSNKCVVCNSAQNEDCALHPIRLTETKTCANNANNKCYTRVTELGETERGCVGELDLENYKNCLGGLLCDVCEGQSCNKSPYPEDRLECVVCNSAQEGDCLESPANSQICPIYNEHQVCVSKVTSNNDIVRGCSEQVKCENDSIYDCELCNSNSCNKGKLLNLRSVGKPGAWQDLPLTCLTCEGDACDSTANSNTCQNNPEQNCVTVFSDDKVISRGCADDVYEKHINHCRDNPGSCHECKSNDCNGLSVKTSLNTCIVCDSSSNPDCAENVDKISATRQCNGKCMTALHPLSNDENPAYEVVRSCLDDKEKADAEACDGEKCKSCSGDKCNVEVLEVKSLSCNHCSGDCEFYESQKCSLFKENDQCFMRFDETNSVVEMGCASKYSSQELTSNARDFFLCDGENCNEYTALPKVNYCVACNSKNDVNCATNPDKVSTATGCGSPPHNTCFSRVNDDGSTERGCLMKLPAENFNECHFNQTSCNSCHGPYCNNEVFPSYRPKCHRCDSSEDESCKSNPDAVSACPVYNPIEQCVSALDGETVIRGCASEVSCTGRVCKKCSGEGCNSEEIKVPAEGFPGLWQELPLNCYKCEGEKCENNEETLSTCNAANIYQNCLTIFGANGKVAKRGCSDDLEADCSANPEKCLPCKSSGCNNAQSEADYVDCLVCDSKNDPNCRNEPAFVEQTRKCHKQCMVALYKTSSSFNVVRSCLDDKDLDDRETCQSGKDSNCEACEGDKCNQAVLPKDDRISCLTCEGDCELPVSELCPVFKEDEQCFVKFDKNEIVQMGCISTFDKPLNDILKTKQVLVCEGENCNKDLLTKIPTAQTCQACLSSNEIDCAIDPINLASHTSCSQLPYSQCYVKINNNGTTQRGCLSTLEGDEFLNCLNNNDPSCFSCPGGICNNKVFPETRLRCHQCNSDTDPNCGKDIQGKVCPIYDENDSCVSSWVDGITYRGCGTELKCLESDESKCKVCKTNHCNTHELEGEPEVPEIGVGEPGLWQDLPLNCYKCEGSNCDDKAILSKCNNNNLQVCTTVFGASGGVEKRGCSDDVDSTHEAYCKANPGKCFSCKSNGCNMNNTLADYIDCAFCDSEKDASCALGSTGHIRKCNKSCMTALYPVSLTDPNPSYALSRSCLDDKEMDDHDTCEGELCNKCTTENCNDQKYPANRLSCHRCNGDDCETPTSQVCNRYRANDVCFTLIDETNSVIQKGCGSDLLSPYIDELLKTKRFYTCEGDNCNDFENIPQAEYCSLCNSKTDPFCAIDPTNVASKTKCDVQGYNQCYSRVLNDGHTERGCLSSLEGDEFISCLKGDSLTCQACVGDTCNQEMYPENRVSCHECSSDATGSCTSAPDSSKVCLLYDANQFCYSSKEGSVTTRGCGDESKCTGEKCNTCRGSDCNTIDFTGDSEVQDDVFGRFQALPLDCYVCKENCSITLGVLETCQGRLRQDCITVFGEDGHVVTRGCSDQVLNSQNSYCNANPDKCFTCKSNECNVAWNTNDYVDCVSCDSRKDVSCINNAESLGTKKCHKTCLTTLFPSVEKLQYDVHRGCADDKDVLDQMLCHGEENCELCTEPSCNKNTFPANRLRCHRCEGEDCASQENLEYCPTYAADDTCVTYAYGKATRGCHSEKICDPASSDLCTQCSGDGCNNEIVIGVTTTEITTPSVTTPTTPQPQGDGCFKCKGDDCEIPKASNCKTNDKCYIKITLPNEIVEMGCLGEYSNPNEINDLIKKKEFYVCEGTNCNDLKKHGEKQCAVCNSESNEDCAINPKIAFSINSNTCGTVSLPYSHCYSRVLDNGHTERGCLETLENDEFLDCLGNNSEKCSSCQGDLCNKEVYPENRLSCATCQGKCDEDSVTDEICLLYKQEKCFAHYNDVGFAMRLGCSSNVTESDLEEWNNRYVLHECTGNSCNALDKIPQNEKCLACDSEKDPRCATAPVMLRGHSEDTCYAPMNKCYTQISGTTTIRGCLRHAGSQEVIQGCEQNTGLCQACSGSQCNDKIYPENRLSCHICNSKDSAECAEEQTSKDRHYCPFYDANDKCVARYNRDGKFTERDCASTNNFTCDAKDEKACQICEGDMCNDAKVGGAATIVASLTVLFLGLIINLNM